MLSAACCWELVGMPVLLLSETSAVHVHRQIVVQELGIVWLGEVWEVTPFDLLMTKERKAL